MAQKSAPNQFQLRGVGVSVSYSTSSIAGTPQLSLKKGRQTLSFSGDEIGVQDTSIGTLVSVVIAKTPDRSYTTFDFLLPHIQVSGTSATQFRTIGITTVHLTTIAGPVKGAQETYKIIPLRGTARQVQFLGVKKVAGSASM